MYPLVSTLAQQQNISLGITQAYFGDTSHTLSAGWSLSQLSGMDLWWNQVNISLRGRITHLVTSNMFTHQLTVNFVDSVLMGLTGDYTLAMRVSAGWSDREKNFALGGDQGPFLLRGYSEGAFRGSHIAGASVEYRIKLLSIWRGLGLQPVFVQQLNAHLFADAGSAEEAFDLNQVKIGVGAELHLVATFWGIGPDFRIGIAQGLDREQPVFYFDMGIATAF